MKIRVCVVSAVACAVLLFSGSASADLVINISPEPGGTRFETAGSVSIASGGSSHNLNGFWLSNRLSGISFLRGINATITHDVISGSGTVSTTENGASSVRGTQVFPTVAFSILTNQVRTYNVGNEFTLSGDFVTSQPYANFVPGTYSDNVVGISFNGGFFQTNENITVNVAAVPEPSSLLFLGATTTALLATRRKKRA